MGIFDIFKTKMTEAADKTGDSAGDATNKTGDMAGNLKDKATEAFDGMTGKKDAMAGGVADMTDTAETPVMEGTHNADEMVAEGSPTTADAPATAPAQGSGGMTGTIKDNLASGADKAGEMADSSTGGKFGDQTDTGVGKAKDMPGNG